ncbi:hypothetical protein ABK040_003628 [Willaertia magna]
MSQLNNFLFATNGANNFGFKTDNFDTTKWNEWQFPSHYKTVEKFVCGSNFAAFHNGSEIYHFGRFQTTFSNNVQEQTKIIWNKFEFKNENNLKIKDLFANYNELIIQLENDEIIYGSFKDLQFCNVGIKFIVCGPLSNHFIVVDSK